jgi:potassium-dependent mechanosensitive channel
MRKSIICFYILFLLILSPLHADVITNTTANDQQSTTNKLPRPDHLRSGWWSFYDTDADKLAKRISQTKSGFASLVEQLPTEHKLKAETILNRILESFGLLLEQKQNPRTLPPPEIVVFAEQHSLSQWDEILIQDEAEKSNLRHQKNQYERASASLKSAKDRLNKQMLTYIDTPDDHKEKFLLGLDVISNRVLIALGTEQLKYTKALLDAQTEFVSKLVHLKQSVSQKLHASSDDLIAIEKTLSELISKRKELDQDLEKANAEAPFSRGNDAFSRSVDQYYAQKLVYLAVLQTNLDLQIALASAKKSLIEMLLDTSNKAETTILVTNLEAWNLLLEKTKENSTIWRIDTLKESNLAQSALVAIENQSSVSNEKLIKHYESRLKQTLNTLLKLKKTDQNLLLLTGTVQEIENRLALRSNNLKLLFNWSFKQAGDFSDKLFAWWQKPLFSIGDTPVTAFGLLRVLLIMIAAAVISSFLRHGIKRLSEKQKFDQGKASALYTVGRLAHYIILLIGLMIALASIGLDFTNLALVAGALSVGIGFGLQSIVNNFVSGLILLFERTLKVGDFIELNDGLVGMVKEINVRSTLINTNDNVDIIVPNSMLVSDRVTNWTLRDAYRRMRIPFSVAYGSDKDLVKKAVLEAASRVRFTHKFKRLDSVDCWLVKFGDSSLDFELVVWVNKEAVIRPGTVHAAYMWEIETSLHEYGIEIPFPQRDLHIRSLFNKKTMDHFVENYRQVKNEQEKP